MSSLDLRYVWPKFRAVALCLLCLIVLPTGGIHASENSRARRQTTPPAGVIVWAPDTGTADWFDGANWSPPGVPGVLGNTPCTTPWRSCPAGTQRVLIDGSVSIQPFINVTSTGINLQELTLINGAELTIYSAFGRHAPSEMFKVDSLIMQGGSQIKGDPRSAPISSSVSTGVIPHVYWLRFETATLTQASKIEIPLWDLYARELSLTSSSILAASASFEVVGSPRLDPLPLGAARVAFPPVVQVILSATSLIRLIGSLHYRALGGPANDGELRFSFPDGFYSYNWMCDSTSQVVAEALRIDSTRWAVDGSGSYFNFRGRTLVNRLVQIETDSLHPPTFVTLDGIRLQGQARLQCRSPNTLKLNHLQCESSNNTLSFEQHGDKAASVQCFQCNALCSVELSRTSGARDFRFIGLQSDASFTIGAAMTVIFEDVNLTNVSCRPSSNIVFDSSRLKAAYNSAIGADSVIHECSMSALPSQGALEVRPGKSTAPFRFATLESPQSSSVNLKIHGGASVEFEKSATIGSLLLEPNSTAIVRNGKIFVTGEMQLASSSSLHLWLPGASLLMEGRVRVSNASLQVSLSQAVVDPQVIFRASEFHGRFEVDDPTRYVYHSSGDLVYLAVDCPAGFGLITSSKCSRCPPAFHSRANVCVACPAGTITSPAGSSCRPCYAGTFLSLAGVCVPCPSGTKSALDGAVVCSPCASESLCSSHIANSVEIPLAALPSSRSSSQTFEVPPEFTSTQIGSIVLISLFGFVGLSMLCCGLIVAVLRGCWGWSKEKELLSKLDILYDGDHRHETPGLMIQRETVLGGVFTVLAPIVLLAIAAFLVLQWHYQPVVTSTVLPFGHLSDHVTYGNLSFNVRFFGYGGPCLCSLFTVITTGISNSSFQCTSESYSCRISVSASSVLSSDATVSLVAPRHTTFLNYEIGVAPHYRDLESIFKYNVFPPVGEVLQGPGATSVVLTMTWVILEDKTYYAAVKRGQGWLVSHALTSRGSTASVASFSNSSSDSVFVTFDLNRGSTYLSVYVDYNESLAVLIGVIFGYLGTVIAVFGSVMRGFEWCHMKRKKERPADIERYESFFDSPLAGQIPRQFHKSTVHLSNNSSNIRLREFGERILV